jgi:FkbM family methyltransferase
MNRIKKPAPFVLLSTGHGAMIVNRNDHHTAADGVTFGVGHQLFETSVYDPGEVDMALQLLELRRSHFGDGVVALDCGANVGVHAIEWARFMTGWGKVVAFEAQERIYYALAGNLALNNIFNASAVHAAIGAEVGTIEVPQLDYSRPASFGSFELKPSVRHEAIGQDIDRVHGAKVPVNLITIDYLECERVDFIKLDIEGMEMEALQGAAQTLALHKPVLIVEHVKAAPHTLQPFLEGLGYACFNTDMSIVAVHRSDPTLSSIQPTGNPPV